MKKTGKTDVEKVIDNLWKAGRDEMERRELTGYLYPDNSPRIAELNEDDRVGVEDVLVIGSFMAMNRVYAELHDDEPAVSIITPEDMPAELKELMDEVIKVVKKHQKKGKK